MLFLNTTDYLATWVNHAYINSISVFSKWNGEQKWIMIFNQCAITPFSQSVNHCFSATVNHNLSPLDSSTVPDQLECKTSVKTITWHVSNDGCQCTQEKNEKKSTYHQISTVIYSWLEWLEELHIHKCKRFKPAI